MTFQVGERVIAKGGSPYSVTSKGTKWIVYRTEVLSADNIEGYANPIYVGPLSRNLFDHWISIEGYWGRLDPTFQSIYLVDAQYFDFYDLGYSTPTNLQASQLLKQHR